jgi:clan AA aspartic protease (TIGR02281 family)
LIRLTLVIVLAVALGYVLGYRQGKKADSSFLDSTQWLTENRSEPEDILDPLSLLKEDPVIEVDSDLVDPADDRADLRSPEGEVSTLNPSLGPMEELLALIEKKQFEEALEMIKDTDFGSLETEAFLLRAKVASQLARVWMEIQRRAEAKDLIIEERNFQPMNLDLLEVEVEWYKVAGRRPEAIQVLNHVLQLALSTDVREQVVMWRHDLMIDHLKLLSDNEQWRELSDFLSGDPASGDDRYYRYQLWAARAHTELFEFSMAKSALEMASFDHDLLDEVEVAKSYIERLQILRHQRVTMERSGEEFPVSKEEGNEITQENQWVELKAKWIRGSIIVNLKIGQRNLPMLIDTGASITSLDEKYRYLVDGEVVKVLGARNFLTANGMTSGEVAQLGKVQLGPFDVSSVDVAFMKGLEAESRYVGLLGMNVLRYFDFQFDEGPSLVRLREKP